MHPKSTALLWELTENLIFYKVQEYERREIHLGYCGQARHVVYHPPLRLHASVFIILDRESQGVKVLTSVNLRSGADISLFILL